MSEGAIRRMTADEFLEWDLDAPDGAHELVNGVPVAMVGARRGHDRIVMNCAREIGVQLGDGPCQPFSEAVGVKIPRGNVRRPDLGVDCAPLDAAATAAGEPRLVIEVLSRSTRALDQVGKLDEYKTVESLNYIALVDPELPKVMLWSRDEDRVWQHCTVAGLDGLLEMPTIGVTLSLAQVYRGLSFRPGPRLVKEGGSTSTPGSEPSTARDAPRPPGTR
jgi:Uma2 family endonuclease